MMSDDMALVREFAASGSEPAFAELVKRHVGLVHSAAMRQVGDAHLAEEIAQAVFIILARKAPKLGPKTILSAWLYRTARYAAADALTARRRRQAREQEAHMQSILNEPDADNWAQLAPLLDDAMAQLGETDRAALVLRYFESKSAGEIAGELQMGEEAAQKRVARALEKLRAIFVKRGVKLSAVALGGTIAANSVQAVPATLVATITAITMKGAAVAASVTTVVNGTIKTISMTTLQKTLIAATLVVAVGAGIYEAQDASTMRSQVKTLQSQQAGQLQQLQNERDDATRQLAALRQEKERLNRNSGELLKLRGEVARLRAESEQSKMKTNDPTESTAKFWLARVNQLKQYIEENPNEKIPEFQFITPREWLTVSDAGLATEDFRTKDEYSRAIQSLWFQAQTMFAYRVQDALRKYSSANNGQFPTDLSQLKSFCEPAVGELLLQLYEIKPATVLSKSVVEDFKIKTTDRMITRTKPVNPDSPSRLAIFTDGTAYWQEH